MILRDKRLYIYIAVLSHTHSSCNPACFLSCPLSALVRTAFTLLSNLAVFVAMWILLNVVDRRSDYIDPSAQWSFSVSVQKHLSLTLLIQSLCEQSLLCMLYVISLLLSIYVLLCFSCQSGQCVHVFIERYFRCMCD